MEPRLGEAAFRLAPGAESLALARRLVRECVAAVGEDERLSYAAQLAVSEVMGSLFEHCEEPVELRWLAAPGRLEFLIRGEAGQRLNLRDLQQRLGAPAAHQIHIRYEETETTARLGFDL